MHKCALYSHAIWKFYGWLLQNDKYVNIYYLLFIYDKRQYI